MMNNYFDYAASTPVSDAVLENMIPWMQENFSNPSAAHREGLKVEKMIQESREIIANKIGAMASEIIFTGSATEANNLAIKGVAFQYLDKKGHIITSSIEHKSVLNTCNYLESLGFEVTYVKSDRYGAVAAESVLKAIKSNTILISLHHVNNELGTIQNIKDIGEIAFDHNIPFHVDAVQGFCKLDIDVDDFNVDFLSISAHKIYGPKGIGALYVRDARESSLVPLVHGGGQELGFRAGTSASALIKGFATAVKSFPQEDQGQLKQVNQSLEKYNYIRNGTQQIANILSITFATDEDEKAYIADNDWLVSRGSSCNVLSNKSSHVLEAIGLSVDDARRTYRISTAPCYL